MEGIIFAASGILNKQVDTSISLVSTRLNEAGTLLSNNSKYSADSLLNLNNQVIQTAGTISQVSNPESRQADAAKFITELQNASAVLNAQKNYLLASQPTPTPYVPYQQTTNTVSTSYTAPATYSQPVAVSTANTPAMPPSQTIQAIDTTQQTIQQTINQMTQIQNQSPSNQVTPSDTPAMVTPTDTPVPVIPTDTTAPLPTQSPTTTQNSQSILAPIQAATPTTAPAPTNPPHFDNGGGNNNGSN